MKIESVMMVSLIIIFLAFLKIIWLMILAHVILSWLINFRVLDINNQLVLQLWRGLGNFFEPTYNRIRNFLPNTNGLDLAPLVVLFGIYALEVIIKNNFSGYLIN
jgi:YggT family protein